ncbi:MAG TPA: hypothetical protein VGZ32_06320, partial [Actinocrinis sp.]|uniref:hypothetical protein n=1 Tax=Actinocrinis sp. TaxID=1920516 RepID=UPI002DDD7F94
PGAALPATGFTGPSSGRAADAPALGERGRDVADVTETMFMVIWSAFPAAGLRAFDTIYS